MRQTVRRPKSGGGYVSGYFRAIEGFAHGWFAFATAEGEPGEPPSFAVYEDDGRGNGDYCGSYATFDAACDAIDRMVDAIESDRRAVQDAKTAARERGK